MWLLIVALGLVQAVLVLFVIYLWVPALAVLVSRLRRGSVEGPLVADGLRRFAILVPAHNEERVLGGLLDSLQQLSYPKERYRVYVVADNCTDATAKLARERGAICYERSCQGDRTKARALSWLWQQVKAEGEEIDAIVLLDADNVVPPNFLEEMNSEFEKGYQVVQGSRRSKNPCQSLASRLDSISESLWQSLNEPGGRVLKLSASLAGSGVAFSAPIFDWLMETGADSVVEDCEWQIWLTLRNVEVSWAQRAIVYDEKIAGLSQIGPQRRRWIGGRATLAKRYFWPLLLSGVRHRNLRQIEGLISILRPPRSILVIGALLLAVASYLFPDVPGFLPWWVWTGVLVSFLVYVLLGLALDHAPASMYLSLLYTPAFAAHVLWATLQAWRNPSRQKWVPTKHSSSLSDHL